MVRPCSDTRRVAPSLNFFGELFSFLHHASILTVDVEVLKSLIWLSKSEHMRLAQRGYLKGVWLCLKHETRQMLRQAPSGEAIVNTSSVNGLGGVAHGSIYAATKAGVIALTKSAATEQRLKRRKVRSLRRFRCGGSGAPQKPLRRWCGCVRRRLPTSPGIR